MPVLVKNRMIYTADLFSHLYGDVFSGRLNAKRALDIEYYQVAYKDGNGNRKEVLADSFELGTQGPGHEFECKHSSSEKTLYKISEVRRMYFDPVRRQYTIFRHPDGDRYKPVQRTIDCELTTLSAQVSVVQDGHLDTFRLEDLLDYTAPMFR